MLHRHRGNRRKQDLAKATRKAKIVRDVYREDVSDDLEKSPWHVSLHELSKGKIHCSCPMCAAKTNGSLNKSKGPVSQVRTRHSGGRIACTNVRMGKKNWKPSEKKKIAAMTDERREYLEAAL